MKDLLFVHGVVEDDEKFDFVVLFVAFAVSFPLRCVIPLFLSLIIHCCKQ